MKNNIIAISFIVLITSLMLVSVSAFSLKDLFIGKATNQRVTCKDSDNGLNYYAKGIAIRCSAGKCNNFSDKCSGISGNLIERYCKSNNVATQVYKCPQGCNYGACIISNQTSNQTITGKAVVNITKTCSDSDGGLNYRVNGTVMVLPIKKEFKDTCLGIFRYLYENYCKNNQTRAVKLYRCPNGCSNGACV